MSFSKAELKRFNEKKGCAPPVGAYDPKDGKKANGGVIEKSERFKHPKDLGPCSSQDSLLSISNPRLSSTPVKGGAKSSNSSTCSEASGSILNKSTVKKPAQSNEHLARIKELELEVRRLLREKSDKDKELQLLHQEQDRLEGRLNSANAERTSCQARSAQLEHEARETKKSLEVLRKQISSTETVGKRKEGKHKDELHSLQQQIHSKEQEIQSTQKSLVQALVNLITDAEECAKHTDGLGELFHRLDISSDITENSDEAKLGSSGSESGWKQIDMKIKKVRRLIKRVSGRVSKLAESGVDKVEAMRSQLQEDHSSQLQQLSSQLAEAQLHHQELQQQLTQQQHQHQHQHQHRLAELLQQHQEECNNMQQKITQLTQDCDQAQQNFQKSQEEYTAAQQHLQQTQDEQQSIQSQMQQEQETLISRLQQEHVKLETELRQSCHQAEEQHQQAREELGRVQEELQQKEAKLTELVESHLQKQREQETASQELREELQHIEEKMVELEKNLLQKEMMHEDALHHLQQVSANNTEVRRQLEDSQDSRVRMQQQIHYLQQEQRRLQDLVTSLQQSRDNLEVESDLLHLAKKELEVKGDLLTDALESLKDDAFAERDTGTPVKAKQLLFEESAERAALEERILELQDENRILNSSIRSLTAKYQRIVHENETDLSLEKNRSQEMQTLFTISEEECEKTRKELEKTELVNKDLLQSLGLFEDELRHLKTREQDRQKELKSSKNNNVELEATIKDLNLRLEREQHVTDSARKEAETRIEQLEMQNKQHQIANEALKGKFDQFNEAFTKEQTELQERCQCVTEEKQRLVEKYKEDLQNVRKALALDRQSMDVRMAEVSLKLERAQTFNCQMKEELKKLLKDKEKVKHDSSTDIAVLQEKLTQTEAKAAGAASQSDLLVAQLQDREEEVARLKKTVTQLEKDVTSKEEEMAQHESTLQHCQSQQSKLEDRLKEVLAKKDALESHVNRLSEEQSLLETDMEKQLHSVQDAALEERTEFERIISEMSEKIQQLEEEEKSPEESEMWRHKYEELFARVEPFMEQLDAFAAERNLLVGRNQSAEAEMAKMMDKYAKLLGHQNQKQKIQYINKLKDEYMQCRKEKEALKEKSNKQQNTIQKLEKRIQSLEGGKTFDPSQAFKHAARKEDVTRSPLKQTNK